MPFLYVNSIAPFIVSLLLLFYYVDIESSRKWERRLHTIRYILGTGVFFLVYFGSLVCIYPYVRRYCGWLSHDDVCIEQNPLLLSGSVFAIVLLLFTMRGHFKLPALKTISILVYVSILIFLITITVVAQTATPPQAFYG